MKRVKVLEVCAKLNIGGAQLVGANIAKYAPDDFEFYYIVFGDEIGEYEHDVIDRGNHVLHLPHPNHGTLHYIHRLMRIIRQEKIDVVHCHTMYSGGIVMLAAWLARAHGRICHSHTAKDGAPQTLQRRLYKALMRLLIRCFSTEYWACGIEAGKELYGSRWFKRHGKVIQNGIAFSDYQYRKESAEEIRQRYGLEGKFVIGHVGHYVSVKNQAFLISLMPEVVKKRPNAILLMFGEGEDRGYLSTLIHANGLEERVRLMGNVRDICKVLSSFDLFVFPSLYEGTPIALIEAQANGLPCLISDCIPDDACQTELIHRLPLEEKKKWIHAIAFMQREADSTAPSTVEEHYESVEHCMACMYRAFMKYHLQGE